MAAVTTMNTYTQIGKVEDVANEVSMISPTATPALTTFGSMAVHNTLYQWQEDTLDAPAANAQVEGFTAIAANENPTLMRKNTTQIFTKTVSTTGTADKVKLYGAGVEFARQMAKKAKEIKRDLELALVGTRQAEVDGSSTVARQFAGVQAQIDSSMVTDMEVLTGLGTVQPLSEAAILAASERAFVTGGEPTLMLIKPSDSIKFAGFANSGGRVRQMDADGQGKKIVNVVDIYVTPFGSLKVVIDRWIATVDAFLLDPGMWKLRPLRGWQTEALAKVGDSRQAMLLGEYGLSHMNFFADAQITNLA